MEKDNQNEEAVSVITMIDDEGNQQEFEFLGETSYAGNDYILIVDQDEAQSEETIRPEIVEVINESETPVYKTVTDKELFEKIMSIFIEENPDDFIYV